MRELRDRNDEQWALLPREDQANTKIAIFVHGFIGAYLGTWGALPELLAANADAGTPFDTWDYLFIGYDTANTETYLDIASLIYTKWDEASSGMLPLGRRYTSLALFGHSLGTLGIRQLLCAWSLHRNELLEAIHSVTLFGTPLNGSGRAKWATWRYKIAQALEPGNAQLVMLRTWLKSARKKALWPEARVVLGLDDKVVGHRNKDLVDWPGDQEPVTLTNFDHRQLVKPATWDESSVVSYVRRALQ